MVLLADAVGLTQPSEDFAVQFLARSEAERMDMIPTGNRLNLGEAGMLEATGEHDVSDEAIAPQAYGCKAHTDLEGDARFLWHDSYRTTTLHQPGKLAEQSDGQRRPSREMVPQLVLRTEM